jgi:hypothetical protein
MAVIISMAASCIASNLMLEMLASRYAVLMSSNSAAALSSRRNAWTTAMPETCSFMVAFIRAVLARISRKASRMRPRTLSTMMRTSGVAANVIRLSFGSRTTISTMMPTRRTMSPTALRAPDTNSSRIASVSFVTRVTKRPTGWRSKNPMRN